MNPRVITNNALLRNSPENSKLITHLSNGLHQAWRSFIEYCLAMGHGEIETLKIQDGLPVLAEVTRKKVKFPQLK